MALDPGALNLTYAGYQPLLVNVAVHVLGDRDDAEDCVQDLMERLWLHPHAYRPERGELRSFLVACVRNAARDRVRARRNGRRLQTRLEERAADREFEFPDVLESQRIQRALLSLSAGQRQALAMHYFCEMTHREIAMELREPLGTIKTRILNGRRRLKALLRSAF